MDADSFAVSLEEQAREAELQAAHHEELAGDPEHREAGNAQLVVPQTLWRIAQAAREAMCSLCFDRLAAERRLLLIWRPGLHPVTDNEGAQ